MNSIIDNDLDNKHSKTILNVFNEVKIVDYSLKSFVIVGRTYPIKNILKLNNGSFNRNLKINGKKIKGWVFSKRNYNNLVNLLETINI